MSLKRNQFKYRTISEFHYKSTLNAVKSAELLGIYSRVSVCRIWLHDFKCFIPTVQILYTCQQLAWNNFKEDLVCKSIKY